jgi:hypothetical protein
MKILCFRPKEIVIVLVILAIPVKDRQWFMSTQKMERLVWTINNGSIRLFQLVAQSVLTSI